MVLGVVPASQTLAHLTMRRPVQRALDLGTGYGIQALLLARHSEAVVSVDVNPRALAFGRFNAALNGVTNVEWREGSWFEPVAHERFGGGRIRASTKPTSSSVVGGRGRNSSVPSGPSKKTPSKSRVWKWTWMPVTEPDRPPRMSAPRAR